MFILVNRSACGHTRFQYPLVRFFKVKPSFFLRVFVLGQMTIPWNTLTLFGHAVHRPPAGPIYAWGPWGSRGDPRIPRIPPWIRLWSEVGWICTCARAHPSSISRKPLGGLRSNFCVTRDPLDKCVTHVWGGVHLHVRTCTPLLHISQTAGRIVFKFCVWQGTH